MKGETPVGLEDSHSHVNIYKQIQVIYLFKNCIFKQKLLEIQMINTVE